MSKIKHKVYVDSNVDFYAARSSVIILVIRMVSTDGIINVSTSTSCQNKTPLLTPIITKLKDYNKKLLSDLREK